MIPPNFKVRFGNPRLHEIRKELGKIDRDELPNAGAVLLRVFFELAVMDYFERTGELPEIIKRLGGKGNLPFGRPTMKQMRSEVIKLAKSKLTADDAIKVERAIRPDRAAPFSLDTLHAFVHHSELPTGRDIEQFWNRTEPLFRLMLEQDHETGG